MPPRIVYLSWPAREITGGIKMAFRHVEMLREAGFDAAIATDDGEPPGWFDTTAPIVRLEAVADDDVLVFPENHRGLLERFGGKPAGMLATAGAAQSGEALLPGDGDGGIASGTNFTQPSPPAPLPLTGEGRGRRVVFCQNPYMVCRGLGNRESYADYGVSAIMAVSQWTAEFCRGRFPSVRVDYVPVYLDRQLFHFQSTKSLQIAFAPRKRAMEAHFIRDVFRWRYPEYRHVHWTPIDRRREPDVAGLLRQSAVYLALCRHESSPLSILEAFACGCVVAGFTGIGGNGFANDSNGFWAGEDDCEACVAQLARAVRLVVEGGQPHVDMLEAAAHTAAFYSRERLARRLVEFWKTFLATPEAGS
jgi:hypothetical protein